MLRVWYDASLKLEKAQKAAKRHRAKKVVAKRAATAKRRARLSADPLLENLQEETMRLFMVHLVTEIDFVDGDEASDEAAQNYQKHLSDTVQNAAQGLSLRTIKGARVGVHRSQKSRMSFSGSARQPAATKPTSTSTPCLDIFAVPRSASLPLLHQRCGGKRVSTRPAKLGASRTLGRARLSSLWRMIDPGNRSEKSRPLSTSTSTVSTPRKSSFSSASLRMTPSSSTASRLITG